MKAQRYSNESLAQMKKFFGIRLSYLLDKLAQKHTLKEIAESMGVRYYVVCRVRNGHYEKISLDYLMHVANSLGLDYKVVVERRNGKDYVTMHGIEQYTNVEYKTVNSKTGLTIEKV